MPTDADDAVAGLDDAVDELYVLPPEDFVGRRDDLAKQARSAGDRKLAAAVRRLKRPTTSAWALNLLSREEPDLVGQLLALGEALRQAQSGLDGAAVRELDKQRRAVVGAMARRAGALAADRGHRLDAELSRQVEQSLGAALSDPDAGTAVTSGQLTRSVSVVGFGVEVDPDAVAVPALVLVGARRRRDVAAGRTTGRAGDRAADRTTGATPGGADDETPDETAAPDNDESQDEVAVEPGPRRRGGRTAAPRSADRSTRSLADARARREQERQEQLAAARRSELRAASEDARDALTAARTGEGEAERTAQEAASQVEALRTRLDELRAEREDLVARLARCDEETAGTTERLAEQEQQQDDADQALLDARRASRQAQRAVDQADQAAKT